MTTVKKRWLVILGVVFVAAVVAVVVWPREKEPVYQGRKLSEWVLRGYKRKLLGEDNGRPVSAIRNIGTNAFPSFLRAIKYQRSTIRQRLLIAAKVVPAELGGNLVQQLTWDNREDYAFAVSDFGFEALGPLAIPIVPDLVRVLNTTNGIVVFRAMRALTWLGDEGRIILESALDNRGYRFRTQAAFYLFDLYRNSRQTNSAIDLAFHCLGDRDSEVASTAALKLSKFGPVSIPLLVTFTHHTNANTRCVAIYSLGDLESEARPATQRIVDCLTDPVVQVRRYATNALRKIAPEELEKLKGH